MARWAQFIAGILTFAGLSSAAPVAGQAVPSDAEVAARADAYLTAMAKIRGIGGSVLIARGDRILLDRGYGTADAEHGVPNGPDTVFRIASISKTITAAAILKLQEQGRLKVEDPFCKYWSPCPPAWQPITLRQLLQHSSGLPNFTDQPSFRDVKRLPRKAAQVPGSLVRLPLNFEPGSTYAYNNTNYLLLGLVIEHASGQSYDDYLRQHFFDRLGMSRTQSDRADRIVAGRARGYVWTQSGPRNADFVEMALHQGNGGLISTSKDLYRWARGLRDDSVLTEASRTAMWTAGAGGYGYGWFVGRLFDRASLAHDGRLEGYSSHLLRFPDDDATIVVLLNSEAGEAPLVAQGLAGILFGQEPPAPVPVSEAILDSYVGRYGPGRDKTLVSRHGDTLVLQAVDRPPEELVAESDTRFVVRITRQPVEFTRDSSGKVVSLVMPRGLYSNIYRRCPDAPAAGGAVPPCP